jgi:NADH-quinone oxidoreductase subunit M
MNTDGAQLLNLAIAVPAIGALLVALMPARRADTSRLVALLASLATGLITVQMLIDYEAKGERFQFVTERDWISDFGIEWHLGVDGISLFLVVLSGLLFPLTIVAVTPEHDAKPYYAWLLVLQAGSIGVFAALDLFVFFVFFEIVLVPMYMLIGGWGHGRRVYAAVKFFLYTMVGSALMLVGIIALVTLQAKATGNPVTFDLIEIGDNLAINRNTARWIFLSFAIAFAVKVPLVPVHTWLPDAHTEAPTAGSVILAGVMLKLGTYGFVRFGLYLFPEASNYFRPLMLTLGVVGILYGAAVATMQKDLKRLVAYSSVAHLGFIILGIFAFTTISLQGAIFQMVNHGISTGALFLLVGMIYERRHTRQISELKGLQKSAPIMAGVFTLVMLSSVGLPGLNGFVGEFLVLLGAFSTARWWAVAAAAGVIIAALYLLWAYQRVFHGTPEGDNATMADLRLSEGLSLAPLLALIVFLGVYPKPMLERMEPSVELLVSHIEANTDFVEPDFESRVPVDDGHDDDHGDDEDHSDDGDADHSEDSEEAGQ